MRHHRFHHKSRCCMSCGAPYYRANRMFIWTTINPGHRMGWIREDLKLCVRCFNAKKAQRVVTLASIDISVEPVKLRAVR